MLRHDNLLAEKYFRLRVEKRSGRPALANLPERTEQESRLIRHVFSSFHCRLCGDCCRSFSFSSEEPNYPDIAFKIEMSFNKFRMKIREHEKGVKVFRAEPSFSGKCGFFERGWDSREIPAEVLEAGGDFAEDGAPFGCGIYSTQPRVCSIFPVSAEWVENPGTGAHLAENAMFIAAECTPVMELFTQGIGHILGREIVDFWPKEEKRWINFGTTLANSVSRVNALIRSGDMEGFHFVTEWGEPVFPIKRVSFPPGSSG